MQVESPKFPGPPSGSKAALSYASLDVTERGLFNLIACFERDYRVFLLSIIARRSAAVLRNRAVECALPQGLLVCGEQQQEIVRRLQALNGNLCEVEAEIVDEVPEVLDVLAPLNYEMGLRAQIAEHSYVAQTSDVAFQNLARQERQEQARQVLFSCAVLAQKCAQRLELLLIEQN